MVEVPDHMAYNESENDKSEESNEITKTIGLACHEFDANYLFDEHGLSPFFACDLRVKDGNGKQVAEFESEGDRWVVKLYYQDSNIIPPASGRTATGSEWSLHEPREFRFKVGRHPEEDSVGEQSFNAHLAPRWQGMKTENSYGEISEFSVPEEIEEGVNVRVQGSNIEFTRYLQLLADAMQAVDISKKYVADPHEFSNLRDAERYVRLDKTISGPIHARDGPIAQMSHLLENDRQGYRKIVQNDDDEHGRNLPGFYHTVTLDERRLREAFPDHRLPKEIKHYYAREAVGLPDRNPLSHPKIGASYQVSLDDEKVGVTEEELEQLKHELDQTVRSVLVEAGIDIHQSRPFIEDAYFEATTTTDGPDPIGLDLTHIESQQDSVVIRHLTDGLSSVQWESLQTLVTDGGEISPDDIADEHDRHPESVRRALRGIEDLVHREYAKVSLRSDHIAELVHDAVREAEKSAQRAAETGAKAIRAAKQGMDETMGVFIAWAAKHDIDVDDALDRRDARMTMRFGEHKSAKTTKRAIREGFRIWTEAGLPAERFRSAQIKFADGSRADAWRYLAR